MIYEEFYAEAKRLFALNAELVAQPTDAQIRSLFELTEIMLETNKTLNLTALTDCSQILLKHYIDSLTVSKYIPERARIIDIGCGAGFPALPLAIFRPDLDITALDATAKRIRYVESTAKALGLDAKEFMASEDAIPVRPPVMCAGCPHRGLFYTLAKKKITVLGDIGCYALDMVLNAIGYPKPLTVSGYKSDFFGKDPNYSGYPASKQKEYAETFAVDDFAAAFIRLEGGIILDFRIAWAMNMDTPGDTLILGTKGGLRIPSTECWNGTVGGPMKIYHEVGGLQTETVVPIIPASGDLFDKKIRSFLDAVKYNRPAPVPTSQIIYNQAILDAIARSAELGREVEVNIPEI